MLREKEKKKRVYMEEAIIVEEWITKLQNVCEYLNSNNYNDTWLIFLAQMFIQVWANTFRIMNSRFA